jgi:hypothetical protein
MKGTVRTDDPERLAMTRPQATGSPRARTQRINLHDCTFAKQSALGAQRRTRIESPDRIPATEDYPARFRNSLDAHLAEPLRSMG